MSKTHPALDELQDHARSVKAGLLRRIGFVDKAVTAAINMREKIDPWHEDAVATVADGVGFDSYAFKMACLDYARNEDQ